MKYLVTSHKGKYEITDTLEQAKKICDRKNKNQVWKWVVRELQDGKYKFDPMTRYLEYRHIDAPVVYNPYSIPVYPLQALGGESKLPPPTKPGAQGKG